MNASRVRAALIIAVLVIGSVLAGAGIDHWVMRGARRPRGFAPPGAGTPEESMRHRAEMLDRMSRDLELSAAQRAGIDSVMQRTDSTLHVFRSEIQPRLRQIFDNSRAEIASRLDSAQRVKFAQTERPRRRAP